MKISKTWIPLLKFFALFVASDGFSFSCPRALSADRPNLDFPDNVPTLAPCFARKEESSEESSDKPNLTVILPAFNESLRIGETLRLYHDFLALNWEHKSEILVVDDGSTDGTADVVQNFSQSKGSEVPVQCKMLEYNQGKGAALSRGIAICQNALVLIADADGSADICCLEDLFVSLQELTQNNWSVPALVVGRRTYSDKSLPPGRLVLRWGFRTAVRLLCGELGVSDTQCGFKLMTRRAAQQLYSELHLQGWSHDVEVLYRARAEGIPVAEEEVLWQDKEGSKLVTSAGGTIGASLKMLGEIAQLRLLYTAGIWKLSG